MKLKKKKKKVKFRSSHSNKKTNVSWIITITVVTFLLAFGIGYVALIYMEKLNLYLAIIILFLIVMMGVFFDTLGIAVTAADETPFHSMAAQKVPASKESIMLIRNASTVANFFNDVIGDISGIISGSATTAIVAKIFLQANNDSRLFGIVLSAIVAAITVGGKAAGKEIALKNSNHIVYKVGQAIHFFIRIKVLFKKKQS